MIELESNNKVSARKLHKWLESKRKFNLWWDFKKEQAELIESKHYLVGHKFVTSFNREYEDYHLTKDASLDLALMEGTKRGKEVRDLLRGVFNERQSGQLFTPDEIISLIDLIKVSFYKDFRDKARRKHLDLYLPKHKKPSTIDYINSNLKRNNICGIDKKAIQNKLLQLNEKFSTIEKGLMKVDKHDLIRICVIDTLYSLGKTKEQSVNAGNFAKKLSIKHDFGSFTRNNEMFTLPLELENTYKILLK